MIFMVESFRLSGGHVPTTPISVYYMLCKCFGSYLRRRERMNHNIFQRIAMICDIIRRIYIFQIRILLDKLRAL